MLSDRIIESFAIKFDKTPRLFFSPGRINLIGEHIDYNDGYVMPAAIDKGVWFAVAPNNTDTVNLYSVDLNEFYSTNLHAISPVNGWQNYILGVIDQVQKNDLAISGFDCAFGGNLPVGAGLSSSAAVECGMLFAVSQLFDLKLSRPAMAVMAQKAEHTFPKMMCGIMDQFASIMGKREQVILLDCKSLDYKYLPLQLQDYALVLINSKVQHTLANGEYNKRRHDSEQGFAILQSHLPYIKSFRDLTPQDVKDHHEHLDPIIYNRCLFVTEEIERTKNAAALLEQNKIEAFGQLMYETHKGLSELYEVSCIESDFLVDKARENEAIIGSRQMGGGFGGCTLNLVRKHNWANAINSITNAYKKHFGIDAEVYEVATGDGTYEEIGG